ncbi:MAG: hypothetical protein WAN39_04205, partial [Candidatus Cybelea sp.]
LGLNIRQRDFSNSIIEQLAEPEIPVGTHRDRVDVIAVMYGDFVHQRAAGRDLSDGTSTFAEP